MQPLRQAVAGEIAEGIRKIQIFQLNPHEEGRRTELQLRYGLENRLFAGAFFGFEPDTELYDLCRASRVPLYAFSSRPRKELGLNAVNWSADRVPELMAEYLRRENCRRVAALVGEFSCGPENSVYWRNFFEARCLECPRGALHFQAPKYPSLVRTVVETMFLPPAGERPDALYIGDDGFTRDAVCGLLDALGPREAAKIAIVSHANFPLIRRYPLEIKFFGLDVREMLHRVPDALENRQSAFIQINPKEQPE